jgi:hypothetical protein
VYDPRNEQREFLAGDRDEAIAKACEFFRLSADQLAIHEPDPGTIFGLASRVLIVAAPLDRRAAPRAARAHGGAGAEEGRSGRRGREGGARERERGGRGDGGHGRDRQRDRGAPRGEGRGGRHAREGASGREPVGPEEPSIGTAVGELGEIGRFVLGAVERMRLGPFELAESREGKMVILTLRGPAGRALAGGDGRPVDGLQLLANQSAMQLSEDPDRIVLDVEGDLAAREGRLGELAERAARRARETGRTIALDPMSGRDRRMIHLALRGVEGVATMSVGEGRYRQVIVVPEGAPEYAEALRESETAAAAASELD